MNDAKQISESYSTASEIRIPPITNLLTTIMSLSARARVRPSSLCLVVCQALSSSPFFPGTLGIKRSRSGFDRVTEDKTLTDDDKTFIARCIHHRRTTTTTHDPTPHPPHRRCGCNFNFTHNADYVGGIEIRVGRR